MADDKKKPPVTSASGANNTGNKDSIGTWEGNPKLRRMFAASRDYDSGEDERTGKKEE